MDFWQTIRTIDWDCIINSIFVLSFKFLVFVLSLVLLKQYEFQHKLFHGQRLSKKPHWPPTAFIFLLLRAHRTRRIWKLTDDKLTISLLLTFVIMFTVVSVNPNQWLCTRCCELEFTAAHNSNCKHFNSTLLPDWVCGYELFGHYKLTQKCRTDPRWFLNCPVVVCHTHHQTRPADVHAAASHQLLGVPS